MDVKQNCCVVGTAEIGLIIYDLRKPNIEYRVIIIILLYNNDYLEIYFSNEISK
jgi:hypothetical protein